MDSINVAALAKWAIHEQSNGYGLFVVEVYNVQTGEWDEHPSDHFRLGTRMVVR